MNHVSNCGYYLLGKKKEPSVGEFIQFNSAINDMDCAGFARAVLDRLHDGYYGFNSKYIHNKKHGAVLLEVLETGSRYLIDSSARQALKVPEEVGGLLRYGDEGVEWEVRSDGIYHRVRLTP